MVTNLRTYSQWGDIHLLERNSNISLWIFVTSAERTTYQLIIIVTAAALRTTKLNLVLEYLVGGIGAEHS